MLGKPFNALEKVATNLQKASFTVDPTKCHLGYKEIKYLGFLVVNGTLMDKREPNITKEKPVKQLWGAPV